MGTLMILGPTDTGGAVGGVDAGATFGGFLSGAGNSTNTLRKSGCRCLVPREVAMMAPAMRMPCNARLAATPAGERLRTGRDSIN